MCCLCALEQKDLTLVVTEARLRRSIRPLSYAIVGRRRKCRRSRAAELASEFSAGRAQSGCGVNPDWVSFPNKDCAREENPVLFLVQQMEANRYNPFTGL